MLAVPRKKLNDICAPQLKTKIFYVESKSGYTPWIGSVLSRDLNIMEPKQRPLNIKPALSCLYD